MNALPSLEHLVALSDDVGILQHAFADVPNRAEGYCTDDVARAFLVALAAASGADRDRDRETATMLGRIYLAFLVDAQLPDGRFHNFMSYGRVWLDDVGTPDSNGRAIWALGAGTRRAASVGWRALCGDRLNRALPHIETFAFLRSQAYAALGLVDAFAATAVGRERCGPVLRRIGDGLVRAFRAEARSGWDWFEAELTYDNGRLPEALLRIGTVLAEPAFVEVGLRALDFLERTCVEDGIFVPIGNDGWYRRGGRRARFDQQPLEAVAMVDAALAAALVTGNSRYRRLAEIAHAWYDGANLAGVPLGAVGGGCRDGLGERGVNANMGAESTLAYLASSYAMALTSNEGLRLVR